MKTEKGSVVCSDSGVRSAVKISHNKHGLCHFRVPTGGANATRKMAHGDHLVLREPPWWLVPKTKFLEQLMSPSGSTAFLV